MPYLFLALLLLLAPPFVHFTRRLLVAWQPPPDPQAPEFGAEFGAANGAGRGAPYSLAELAKEVWRRPSPPAPFAPRPGPSMAHHRRNGRKPGP